MIDSVCSCMESDVYLLHWLHTYLNMLGIFVCKNDFIWTGALTQNRLITSRCLTRCPLLMSVFLLITGYCYDNAGRPVAPGQSYYDGCNTCTCGSFGEVTLSLSCLSSISSRTHQQRPTVRNTTTCVLCWLYVRILKRFEISSDCQYTAQVVTLNRL